MGATFQEGSIYSEKKLSEDGRGWLVVQHLHVQRCTVVDNGGKM